MRKKAKGKELLKGKKRGEKMIYKGDDLRFCSGGGKGRGKKRTLLPTKLMSLEGGLRLFAIKEEVSRGLIFRKRGKGTRGQGTRGGLGRATAFLAHRGSVKHK